MSDSLTPMMRQYLNIKEEHKDAILFFRLGDFYEMFFDDAREASRILHITLTAREAGKGNKVPMCGVPYHAADNYIARLIRSGKKVAICEQVEEPSPGKKIVKREIVKTFTPGTFVADSILADVLNNYLLSIYPSEDKFGIAYSDISTGEFRVTELASREDLFAELYKISPSECLVPESFSKDKCFSGLKDISLGVVTVSEDWTFDYEFSLKEIKNHFSVKDLGGFGCQDMPLAVRAAGALIKYLRNTQKSSLANIDVISTYNVGHYMTLDRNSQRNLELVHNLDDFSESGTLLDVLDETRTTMGKRRLKAWILNPLLDVGEIRERLDAVGYLYQEASLRQRLRDLLEKVYDVDRLSNKMSLGTGNARDMLALAASLKSVMELKALLSSEMADGIASIKEDIDDFSDITGWIEECVTPEPPVSLKEGGLVKNGYNTQVDELRGMINGGKDWIIDLRNKEAARTGINSLKVGYNSIFGYYIEVTKPNLSMVPSDYVRKQTLVNAERFITEELKEYETKIIGAEDRIRGLEHEIFCTLREKVSAQIERLKRASDVVADLDVFASLAETAVKNKYVRPEVTKDGNLRITEGRHPVIEKLLKDKEFVPNDLVMGEDTGNIFIITGSNMAGKSTYIRQTALITVMAQMGSFVPAKAAAVGVVDRVFTRVGASDRLHRGMSTFMVEMLETANILNNATQRSLIILDEIGRGTSTFDGVSIAWAVIEYIHRHLRGAKTLFATHFHEITELAQILNGVKNYNLAVREWKDEVIFLYKVVEGNCDESFGIHVAKLAGVPEKVVVRAREILENLQKDSFLGNIRMRFAENRPRNEKQLDFFEVQYKDNPVVDKIKEIPIDSLTPLEALKLLSDLKKEVNEK